MPQTPPAPPAPPVAGDAGTVRLELRIFDGPDDVTGETRVRLFPRGQRTNDLPTTSAPGQAITATVPVGFYDAQAIREKRGEVAGLRWAEQLLVQRYPDEYGRHLQVINFKPGYGALQIRPSPDAAAAAKGWTGICLRLVRRDGQGSRQSGRRRRRPAVRAARRQLRRQADDGRQEHAVDARHRGAGGPDAAQDLVDRIVVTLVGIARRAIVITLGDR